jgi:sigma-B regulation protein RsbU (phosphoserine phosphatase)
MIGHATSTDTTADWAFAGRIQARFMQVSRPIAPGLDCGAHCRQIDTVGGDFYHFLPLNNGCVSMAVGDAAGKGLPGALMVSNVQSSVRTATLFAGDDLPLALEVVNRQVYESSLAEQYATLFCCVFDGSTRLLRYINAGHPPAILVRANGSVLWLESGGAPVGLFPDWKYQEGVVEIGEGDILIAFTDGVIEATNPGGEEWGVDSLRTVVTRCAFEDAKEIVRRVFVSLDEFTGAVQNDDATVVALRFV